MEGCLKSILESYCSQIVSSVSAPCELLSYLRPYLTESDCEKIVRDDQNHGHRLAMLNLHLILHSRGNKAFFCFVDALCSLKNEDLAEKLMKEVPSRLLGEAASCSNIKRFVRPEGHDPQAEVVPPEIAVCPRKDNESNSTIIQEDLQTSSAVEQPTTRSSGIEDHHRYGRSAITHNQEKITRLDHHVVPESVQEPEQIGLSDLISKLSCKHRRYFCSQLNRNQIFDRNWHGIADQMKLSPDEQRIIEEQGKMEELFEMMQFQEYTLGDFDKMLLELKRLDLHTYLMENVVTLPEELETQHQTEPDVIEHMQEEAAAAEENSQACTSSSLMDATESDNFAWDDNIADNVQRLALLSLGSNVESLSAGIESSDEALRLCLTKAAVIVTSEEDFLTIDENNDDFKTPPESPSYMFPVCDNDPPLFPSGSTAGEARGRTATEQDEPASRSNRDHQSSTIESGCNRLLAMHIQPTQETKSSNGKQMEDNFHI